MNRSNPWASDWLKRYDKEGIGGLKDKQKSGRHPELPSDIEYKIRPSSEKATRVGRQSKLKS